MIIAILPLSVVTTPLGYKEPVNKRNEFKKGLTLPVVPDLMKTMG
jgi:hypothetical protein